jgi:hypothetical protein
MRITGPLKLMLVFAAFAVVFLPVAWTVADESMVVVSRPGTVFHKAGSDDIRGPGYEKSLEEAMAAGYTPCHVCFGKAASSLGISASMGAGGAAHATSGGFGGLSTLSSLKAPVVEQPFGEKEGGGGGSFRVKGAIKDPFSLETITHPGAEQGAYCTCQCTKNYPPAS